MLADFGGNRLLNTNEIRSIRIQCVNYGNSKRWDVFVYTIQDGIYESTSSHETEAEALENFERVRAILQTANCLIDLSVVNNKKTTPILKNGHLKGLRHHHRGLGCWEDALSLNDSILRIKASASSSVALSKSLIHKSIELA